MREAVPQAIPLVGNGDVVDVEGYRQIRERTGCDAVMIGRGAIGNPWLFRSIRAIERGELDPGVPSLDERIAVFARHVELIRELKPEVAAFHEIRKACAWYAKGLRGCNQFRKLVWALAQLAEERQLREGPQSAGCLRRGTGDAIGTPVQGRRGRKAACATG